MLRIRKIYQTSNAFVYRTHPHHPVPQSLIPNTHQGRLQLRHHRCRRWRPPPPSRPTLTCSRFPAWWHRDRPAVSSTRHQVSLVDVKVDVGVKVGLTRATFPVLTDQQPQQDRAWIYGVCQRLWPSHVGFGLKPIQPPGNPKIMFFPSKVVLSTPKSNLFSRVTIFGRHSVASNRYSHAEKCRSS